jgi:nicotinate-nucleotide adenylyltransferase
MADVGVLGGTFDPVHIGHVVTALEVRHQLGLDRVLFVVANQPWQKDGSVFAGPADRLAMVEAAIEGIDGLVADATEIRRGGPSYMADTLAELHGRLPVDELFLVVGCDAAAGLETWERPDEVRRLATLVVVDREGTDPGRCAPAGWPHRRVQVPRLDIASRDLRVRLSERRPIDGLVPARVMQVIRERGLYGPVDDDRTA